MKHIRVRQGLVPYLLLAMLLTACGDKMPRGPGTADPNAKPSNSPKPTSSLHGSTSDLDPSGGPFACVDWVRFDTRDLYDNAGLVLIGTSVSRAGETTIYGHKAMTHLVEVEQVIKGGPRDGNLRISSMPPTCTGGESYPDGDPLDPNQRVIIFAKKQGGDWFTVTPAQGVLPFPQGAELPFH
jgi:hypothetical protein